MLARHRPRRNRRGATMVEAAIVLPVLFSFLLGLIVIGMGTFRYQQVAALAREGARYASVHGGSYATATGKAAADQAAITAYIKSKAVGLDLSKLTCTAAWSGGTNRNPTYMFDATTNTYRINYVTVTVNYSWTPEAILSKTARTLTSTSTMPVTF